MKNNLRASLFFFMAFIFLLCILHLCLNLGVSILSIPQISLELLLASCVLFGYRNLGVKSRYTSLKFLALLSFGSIFLIVSCCVLYELDLLPTFLQVPD